MSHRDLLRPSGNLPFEILRESAKIHSKAVCRCSEEEEGNCSIPELDIVNEPLWMHGKFLCIKASAACKLKYNNCTNMCQFD